MEGGGPGEGVCYVYVGYMDEKQTNKQTEHYNTYVEYIKKRHTVQVCMHGRITHSSMCIFLCVSSGCDAQLYMHSWCRGML